MHYFDITEKEYKKLSTEWELSHNTKSFDEGPEVEIYDPSILKNLHSYAGHQFPEWVRSIADDLGKHVKSSNIDGILIGFSFSCRDYYYIIYDIKENRIRFNTGVAGYDVI